MKTQISVLFIAAILIAGCSTSASTPDVNAIYTQAYQTALASLPKNTPTPLLPTNTTIPSNTPLPTNTPIPTATPNPNLINAGTYIVGTDIKPGIYRGETGIDTSESCYWARLKDLSGGLDSIVANDNSVGQYYVEIRQGDYAFETHCGMERLVSLPEPPSEFPLKIETGTYLVGRDIAPGTYKGQGGSDISGSCYWERLKNVAGGFDGIITNDNAVGQFYVQVAGSDFALKTACELDRVGN